MSLLIEVIAVVRPGQPLPLGQSTLSTSLHPRNERENTSTLCNSDDNILIGIHAISLVQKILVRYRKGSRKKRERKKRKVCRGVGVSVFQTLAGGRC